MVREIITGASKRKCYSIGLRVIYKLVIEAHRARRIMEMVDRNRKSTWELYK